MPVVCLYTPIIALHGHMHDLHYVLHKTDVYTDHIDTVFMTCCSVSMFMSGWVGILGWGHTVVFVDVCISYL